MPKLSYAKGGGKALSYSRRDTLVRCARKFEIENRIGYRPVEENMTFAYGHMVGEGIQAYIETRNLETAIYRGALAFDLDDIFAEGTYKEVKAKKSFWYAADIIQRFAVEFHRPGSLVREQFADWEIARFEHQGKMIPATELTFEILFDEGFSYEGHIDAVLYNRKTRTYAILELKTSSFTNLHAAQYQNSDQALSYSIVLDKIAGDLNANSSYKVIYLVAKSSKQEFETFEFTKSVLDRSNFIANLGQDIDWLKMLLHDAEEYQVKFPKRGGACFDFFRPCTYFNTCGMSNSHFERLVENARQEDDESVESFGKAEPVMFSFTHEEIIERQMELLDSKIPIAELTGEGADDYHSDGTVEIL